MKKVNCKFKQLSKNKVFEIEWGIHEDKTQTPFECATIYNRKTDHAGWKLCLEFFGLYLYIMIYDTRHWDYDNNKWMEYDD